jgi:hypothetical protein
MVTEKLITIKEVSLNNNCPECYNTNGLQLTFKQKFKETKLFKSITSETTQEINCKTCHTKIYPISWTDDIERVFNYHQKAFVPKKPSLKLKKLAWILIGITVIIIVLGLVFLIT